VELLKITLPAASGSAASGAAVSVGIDAAHDTAAERKTVGEHLMRVTPVSAPWIDDSEAYMLKLTVDAAATTAFTLYGARALFELRA